MTYIRRDVEVNAEVEIDLDIRCDKCGDQLEDNDSNEVLYITPCKKCLDEKYEAGKNSIDL